MYPSTSEVFLNSVLRPVADESYAELAVSVVVWTPYQITVSANDDFITVSPPFTPPLETAP
jgi:hypothetical protein